MSWRILELEARKSLRRYISRLIARSENAPVNISGWKRGARQLTKKAYYSKTGDTYLHLSSLALMEPAMWMFSSNRPMLLAVLTLAFRLNRPDDDDDGVL